MRTTCFVDYFKVFSGEDWSVSQMIINSDDGAGNTPSLGSLHPRRYS
jgi:hypothetical protein